MGNLWDCRYKIVLLIENKVRGRRYMLAKLLIDLKYKVELELCTKKYGIHLMAADVN